MPVIPKSQLPGLQQVARKRVSTALFDTFNREGKDVSVPCHPQALVLFCPVIDTSEEGYGQAKLLDHWKELSPAHQVPTSMPPTPLLHGTADITTPFKGAELFSAEMQRTGNQCELVAQENAPHNFMSKDEKLYGETLRHLDAFLSSLGLVLSDKSRPSKP